MQRVDSVQQVLLYKNSITFWSFYDPKNLGSVPVYQGVLEEFGRERLCYSLNLARQNGPEFCNDVDNAQVIDWALSQDSFDLDLAYDGGATDVRTNSGEMVPIRGMFWIFCDNDSLRLFNKSDIWVPVANELGYELHGSKIYRENESYVNKYASENSLRLEKCLQAIQDRFDFQEVNDEPDIHLQAGFRMYNHEDSLKSFFPGAEFETVQHFSWERFLKREGENKRTG